MKVAILLSVVGCFLLAADAAPQSRTMDCKILGHTACKVHCLFTTGRLEGYCDENEDCHCEKPDSYYSISDTTLEKVRKIGACLYLGGFCVTEEKCGQNPHENTLCQSDKTCCWIHPE